MAGVVCAGSGTSGAAAAAPVGANAGAEADDWASVALHSSSNSSPMIRAVGSRDRENNSDTVGPLLGSQQHMGYDPAQTTKNA